MLDRPQNHILEESRPLSRHESRGPQGGGDLRCLVAQKRRTGKRSRRGRRGSSGSGSGSSSSSIGGRLSSFSSRDPPPVAPGHGPRDDLRPQRFRVAGRDRGERERALAVVRRRRRGAVRSSGDRSSSCGGSRGAQARRRGRGDKQVEGLQAPERDLGRRPLVPCPGRAGAPSLGRGPDRGAVGDCAGLLLSSRRWRRWRSRGEEEKRAASKWPTRSSFLSLFLPLLLSFSFTLSSGPTAPV